MTILLIKRLAINLNHTSVVNLMYLNLSKNKKNLLIFNNSFNQKLTNSHLLLKEATHFINFNLKINSETSLDILIKISNSIYLSLNTPPIKIIYNNHNTNIPLIMIDPYKIILFDRALTQKTQAIKLLILAP